MNIDLSYLTLNNIIFTLMLIAVIGFGFKLIKFIGTFVGFLIALCLILYMFQQLGVEVMFIKDIISYFGDDISTVVQGLISIISKIIKGLNINK